MMNNFIPNQQFPMPAFYANVYSQYNQNMAAVSCLQIELRNIQQNLFHFQKENASLKSLIQQLHAQLEIPKKTCESISPFKADSIETATPKSARSEAIQSKAIIISPPHVKIEDNSSEVYDPTEDESAFTSPEVNIKFENEDFDSEDEYSNKKVPMRRRNGFKKKGNDSEDDKKKIPRSKAKHLWITYGRKIIEYAMDSCKGATKKKIKDCTKLVSKKGYSEVFLIRRDDSENEIEFKKTFGKLALEFLDSKAEDSFLNSNYRDELLSQKEKVQNWIKKQIQES